MTSSRFGRKDIISDLPRNIIESILERMPVRDAARTSTLSSKWRYFWTTISRVVLDSQFFEETCRIKPIVQHELAKAVEKFFLLRNGPIQKFVICLPVIPFNGCSDIIDHCILFLSKNSIKDLTLDNSTNTPYEMHSCFYSCQELTQLKLVNCILKPPRELSDFQNVIGLDFDRVTFGKYMLRTLLSRSGLLQRLSIKHYSGIGRLIIHAPNLKVLIIFCNSGTDSLSLVGSLKLRLCVIAPGKTMASLTTTSGQTPSLVEFLDELPRVSDLGLDRYFLELLAAGAGPRRLPTRSTFVNSLFLNHMVFSDFDVFSCTLLLIRSCPNMKKLSIWFCSTTDTFDERVANYLEASACMDQSEQTLATLLSVNIYSLKGLKPQLLLIKLFLACSPMLEKMYIALSKQLSVIERFKIARELSKFPRLSPKAAVLF